jgi:hypothetical protein
MWLKDISNLLVNNAQILHHFACKQHYLRVYSTLENLYVILMKRNGCFCEAMTANHHA